MSLKIRFTAVGSLTLLTLIGCASSHTVRGPDGTTAQLIQCSYGIRDCYAKAAEICGGNYHILDSGSSVYNDGYGTSTTQRLLVECY